jgi:hypothetical protein
VNHGIRYRLTDRHVYAEGNILTDPQPIHEFGDYSGSFVNSLYAAGEC